MNENGTLILHANPQLTYTSDQTDYCGQAGLAACSLAMSTVPYDGTPRVLHVLAAFPDTAQPRLKALSWGVAYDPAKVVIAAHGPCGAGEFDIPDNGWPGNGSGIGQSWTATRTSILNEIYWFAAYAYGAADTTSLRLTPHPLQGGVFVDDSVPPVTDSVADFGCVGFGLSGRVPCPQGESSGGELPGEDEPTPESVDELTFVELTTSTDGAFVDACRALEREYGLSVDVGLAPDGLFCRANERQRAALRRDARVIVATDRMIADAGSELSPGDPGFSELVWNAMITATPPQPAAKDLPAPIDSVFVEDERTEPGRMSHNQTSVYMLGEVGVSLLFLESDDDRPCDPANGVFVENWGEEDPDEIAAAIAEAGAGLMELVTQAAPASLTFLILENPVCATDDEPIRTGCSTTTWKVDALQALGFQGNSASAMARALNNDRRRQYGTDWWITMFVARSECNNGWFGTGSEVGLYGCAAYYGPYGTVCSHPHSRAMGWVLAHETVHTFGAPDEYAGCSCDGTWGYLRWDNRNSHGAAGDQHCHTHVPCMMAADWTWTLCEDTRRHVGWWDRDSDSIYDPLDHPDSGTSMLIGPGAESLSLGDSVNVYTAGGEWLKRLDASNWAMDQGAILWDGIDYRGLERGPGEYRWKRNGGTPHTGYLASDAQAPVITDLVVAPGQAPGVRDTLRFRLQDDDTHGGRVRVDVQPGFGPTKRLVEDEFLKETLEYGDPVERVFTMPAESGYSTLRLLVWDVGAGQSASESIEFWPSSGVGEPTILVPEVRLSAGHPNPSGQWVNWAIERPHPGTVDLAVVAVDGRRIKSWPGRQLPSGVTRVLWDGQDDRGIPVPSGRYFLVARDSSGQSTSRSATIVR